MKLPVENTDILTGFHKSDEMNNEGNLWISAIREINDILVFPEWIQNEEKRLLEDYYRRNN